MSKDDVVPRVILGVEFGGLDVIEPIGCALFSKFLRLHRFLVDLSELIARI